MDIEIVHQWQGGWWYWDEKDQPIGPFDSKEVAETYYERYLNRFMARVRRHNT